MSWPQAPPVGGYATQHVSTVAAHRSCRHAPCRRSLAAAATVPPRLPASLQAPVACRSLLRPHGGGAKALHSFTPALARLHRPARASTASLRTLGCTAQPGVQLVSGRSLRAAHRSAGRRFCSPLYTASQSSSSLSRSYSHSSPSRLKLAARCRLRVSARSWCCGAGAAHPAGTTSGAGTWGGSPSRTSARPTPRAWESRPTCPASARAP